jgi:sulfur carrier protein
MIVTLNGEQHEVAGGATVASLVALLTDSPPEGRGVAVAVGGEVVPRGQWATTPVHDGAQVEVVAAIQGG